jgi:putative oxidoreductase
MVASERPEILHKIENISPLHQFFSLPFTLLETSSCIREIGSPMVTSVVCWFLEPPDEAPAVAAAILDRIPVGAIFLIEGILKFRSPEEFGVGRFARIGIPAPHFFAPFDGFFEIACGILLLFGLFTRFAVIPMMINMLVALYTTKLPILGREGFWKMAHAALLDYAMLFGLISILIAGAGSWSLDERLEYRWRDVFR